MNPIMFDIYIYNGTQDSIFQDSRKDCFEVVFKVLFAQDNKMHSISKGGGTR